MKYHNDNYSSDEAIGIKLSKSKIATFKKQFNPIMRFIYENQTPDAEIDEHLIYGESCPAKVIKNGAKLIVSVYSGDLDAVLLLSFENGRNQYSHLSEGTKLLSVNTYRPGIWLMKDIIEGEFSAKQFKNFEPFIAEFLSDDIELIDQRKAEITNEEWQRFEELTKQYIQVNGMRCRSGNPYKCLVPAGKVKK